MGPKLTTSVYCVQDDSVLMLERIKDPFQGCWVAPGGKIEELETPRMAAIRELREETGLIAKELTLAGIVRELSPDPTWGFCIFYYVVTKFSGELLEQSNEGALEWVPRSEMLSRNVPEADRVFTQDVLDLNTPMFEGVFRYDENFNLLEVKRDG